MVDSGSPVTIVSLGVLLQGLAAKRTTQTPEEWTDAVKKRLQKPTVAVRAYDGAELAMHAEITAEIAFGDRKHVAPVLVQKDAPEDLLLGTDFLPYLKVLRLAEQTQTLRKTVADGSEVE